MKTRVFALAFAFALPPALILPPGLDALSPRSASAVVALQVSVDELLSQSRYVVVATAGERHSFWEETPAGRRIVTYTKLRVERAVVGTPGSELWVRTLGGEVDRVGQSVSGEARIASGSRALLFLADEGGTLAVTALAQGHYPIVAGAGGAPERLAPSPDLGMIVPRGGPSLAARDRLVGAVVEDAVATVTRAHQARQGGSHAPQ